MSGGRLHVGSCLCEFCFSDLPGLFRFPVVSRRPVVVSFAGCRAGAGFIVHDPGQYLQCTGLITGISDYHKNGTNCMLRQMTNKSDFVLGAYTTYLMKVIGDNPISTLKKSKTALRRIHQVIYYEMKYGF
jgi:hypothetical protein